MAVRPTPVDRVNKKVPELARKGMKAREVARQWNSQPHPKMGWDDTKVDTSRVSVEPLGADVRRKHVDQMTDDLLERRKTNPPPRLQQVLDWMAGKHPAQGQHEHEQRQAQKTFEKTYPNGLPRLGRRSGGGSFATPEPNPSPRPSPRPRKGEPQLQKLPKLEKKEAPSRLKRWSD